MDNGINQENRHTKIRDFVFDEDGYLHFNLIVNDTSLPGIFCVYDKDNENSMKIISIENASPAVLQEWDELENDLRNISQNEYLSIVSKLSFEGRCKEAMQLAGFEEIELDSDALATVGFENPATGEKVLSDGWEGIKERLDEITIRMPNRQTVELINQLIHPHYQFSYYALNVEDVEKNGYSPIVSVSLTDTLEQYHQFRGKKLVGIDIVDENGEEVLNITASTFDPEKQKHLIMDEIEINFYADAFGQERETIMNMYEKLVDRLYHENAYELVYQTLIRMKNEAMADIGNVYYCRIANNDRPQDYFEMTLKDMSEVELGVEIKVVHANEVIYEDGYAMDVLTMVEQDKLPDFDWKQEIESILGVRSLVDRLETTYSEGFTLYSNDLSECEALQNHFLDLTLAGYDEYPSEPVIFTGDLQDIVNSMTEDDKEALVQGVEAARDYNQEIPESDQKLYEVIIAERSRQREMENELKKEEPEPVGQKEQLNANFNMPDKSQDKVNNITKQQILGRGR